MEAKQYATKQPADHEEIKEEIKIHLETNDEDTMIQSQWDTAKAILREKIRAIQSHLRK